MLRNISAFRFSVAKFYDVVFVGPLGARLSRELYHTHGSKFSCLNINSSNLFSEPTLYPIDWKPLKISQTICPQYPVIYSHISQIVPEQNLIVVNGQKIHYNQLVYTANNEPDYDKYQGLKEALQNQCNNVFVDNGQNIESLKGVAVGNLVFSIPAGRHVGYNYQFLYVTNLIRRKFKNNKEDALSVNSILILEDGKIFRYNHDLDQYVKKLCRESNIRIIQNVKVDKINTSNRSLTLSSGQSIPYSGFYQYMPLKSKIEGPTNPQTLINQKYNNIFVFGNAEVPTTHSYGAKNYQLRVAKHNLLSNLLRTKNKALYDGRTFFPFWSSDDRVIYFSHSYTKKLKSYGKFRPFSMALAAMDKYLAQDQVSNYYKFNTYGYPYYLWNKKYKTVKSFEKRDENIPKEYDITRKIQI